MPEEVQHRPSPEVQMRVDDWVKEVSETSFEPLEVETEPKPHCQYYEPAEGTGGLPAVVCTCGQKKHHLRLKVLEAWSLKHFNKTGHNTKN